MSTKFCAGDNTSCEEIAPLLEDMVAGIALSEKDKKVAQHHISVCEDCGNFMEWISDLNQIMKTPSTESTGKPPLVFQKCIEQYFHLKARKRLAIVATTLSVAAALILFMVTQRNGHFPTQLKTTQLCAATEASEVAPEVWMTHCKEKKPTVQFDSKGNLLIKLDEGSVGISANPNRPQKHTIVIRTRFGNATVLGTIFSVSTATNDARVEVFRGKVRVESAATNRRPFVVDAGYGAWFTKEQQFEIKGSKTNSIYQQLSALGGSPKNHTETLLPSTDDDDLTDSSQVDTVDTENRDIELGDNSKQTGQTVANVGSGSSLYKNNAKDRRKELNKIIQEAQYCLIDQRWTCAETKYRQVLKQYGDQWEAVSALVSLAKIELRHLGKPNDALRHFSTYKKRYPNGPLLEDAIFGIAEAYRRMGNEKMELKVMRQFISQYPSSSSVAKAQKRIDEIEGQSP